MRQPGLHKIWLWTLKLYAVAHCSHLCASVRLQGRKIRVCARARAMVWDNVNHIPEFTTTSQQASRWKGGLLSWARWPQVTSGTGPGWMHANQLWHSAGQSMLRVDFQWRWHHSPSFQNGKYHHECHCQVIHLFDWITDIHELWGNFLILQVINYQNKTLKQYSKLKLNQEKIGLFVLKRHLKLPDWVVRMREKIKVEHKMLKKKSTLGRELRL